MVLPAGELVEFARCVHYSTLTMSAYMLNYLISHRWTRSTIAVIEAPTYARALEWASRRGVPLIDVDLEGLVLRSAFLAEADLRGAGLIDADLTSCYLRNADLRGADLRGARLVNAFLGATDLRQADLREAQLSHADLRGAKLAGADLRGTIMTGARLADAVCDWRWSVIPAELLRQHHDSSAKDERLVIDLAFYEDERPWGWLKLISNYGSRANWALDTLAQAVRDGDNAPELLRSLATDASASITTDRVSSSHEGTQDRSHDDGSLDLDPNFQTSAPFLSTPKMLWTCRRMPRKNTANVRASH